MKLIKFQFIMALTEGVQLITFTKWVLQCIANHRLSITVSFNLFKLT